MYVRVTVTGYDPTHETAVLDLIDESLIPALKQLPGFVSYTSGTDSEKGKAVSITVWDNMDHAAGLRAALGGMIQQFEDLNITFEPPQIYELTRHITV